MLIKNIVLFGKENPLVRPKKKSISDKKPVYSRRNLSASVY
jgi:hypothetical protein